jgi:hypothetical protein
VQQHVVWTACMTRAVDDVSCMLQLVDVWHSSIYHLSMTCQPHVARSLMFRCSLASLADIMFACLHYVHYTPCSILAMLICSSQLVRCSHCAYCRVAQTFAIATVLYPENDCCGFLRGGTEWRVLASLFAMTTIC